VKTKVNPEELATQLKDYKYGWEDLVQYSKIETPGLTRQKVANISEHKNEPGWMREFRLRGYDAFMNRPVPSWGADLSGIDFDEITYYRQTSEQSSDTWDEVPSEIRETYNKLGIPQAEQDRLLSGVTAQYESTAVYHKVQSELENLGVVFMDTDTALKEVPELVKKYFATVIPVNDNKFAALNTAVWSGGSFIWVPPGVEVELPLQAYFRINSESMGQFERTLIIAEPGSKVHYVEGCSAPLHSKSSLHSAVVEILVKDNAKVRYTTIQNWSNNVYNLVTKRARVKNHANMEWHDVNAGSKVTMKYPAIWLEGEGASGEVLSAAYAGDGQHQDTGAKIIHVGANTRSNVLSKSLSRGSGETSYRGLVHIDKDAVQARASVQCDALLLNEESRTNTYPYMEIERQDASIEHEASVSKLSETQMFYMQSRGLAEEEAKAMIVKGFLSDVIAHLPMEYAVELNRLFELDMRDAVG